MTHTNIEQFQCFVLRFHRDHGRHHLPWRTTHSPYHVLVSEIMLQQTQVDRVIPKFNRFMTEFPTIQSLATASVAQVIKHWQGLGYNRRGLNLQRAAQAVCSQFDGKLPRTSTELLSLPGIGPYTASAIQAFAFNQPVVVIETNIRTVYIHHFFHQTYNVSDSDLFPLIEATISKENPRLWYSALMDYGTYLKKVLPNPSRQSRHYSKQSKFKGSMREVRGGILSAVTKHKPITIEQLLKETKFDEKKLTIALESLIVEGFLSKTEGLVSLKA